MKSGCWQNGQRKDLDEMSDLGKVYLVGAGPGDPGLMTEKGLRRLRECDAVVYDHLASERFLDEVREDCQKIYVGKQAGRHYKKQPEINAMLVELAGEGRTVVRLKGGDPFVFGRGGEEVQELQRAGIPFEVVPGVTSAVAALSSAGIPVTHRAVSRSFHVMTGHTMTEAGSLPLDFNEFAKLNGTLVFLMGLTHLPLIVKGLLENGKSGNTPAAVVENGTLASQRVVRGTLEDIEEKAKAAGIGTPAIIVAGDVAALDFSSTIHAPLEGIRVAVTGTDSLAGKLRASLELLGAYTECVLTMDLESLRCGAEMTQAYGRLKTYSWIVFTSANAVREFFAGLSEHGYDHRAVCHVKFAVVGRGTGKELKNCGFLADYIPEKFDAASLAEGLVHTVKEGERLLIPRSRKGSSVLTEILSNAGIAHDDIVLYDVAERKREEKALAQSLQKADYLTFASGSAVDAFFEGLDRETALLLDHVKLACIGEITERALNKKGRQADITAKRFTVDGLVKAICEDVKR